MKTETLIITTIYKDKSESKEAIDIKWRPNRKEIAPGCVDVFNGPKTRWEKSTWSHIVSVKPVRDLNRSRTNFLKVPSNDRESLRNFMHRQEGQSSNGTNSALKNKGRLTSMYELIYFSICQFIKSSFSEKWISIDWLRDQIAPNLNNLQKNLDPFCRATRTSSVSVSTRFVRGERSTTCGGFSQRGGRSSRQAPFE